MGRLYRRPDVAIDPRMSQIEAVRLGLLVPSVTNVLGVQNQPHLMKWAARLAAETAYDAARDYPARVTQNPKAAVAYARDAAERYRDEAATRGSRVHDVLENLSRGNDVEIEPDIAGYVRSWHRFMDDWEPEWLGIELTTFGSIEGRDGSKLGFAGTADGIARFRNGLHVVLDYKTGRSVHASAAGQLAALAHAGDASEDGVTIIPTPDIHAGMVVHITSRGYSVHPVGDLDGAPWDAFRAFREAWEWHVHEDLYGKQYALLPKISSPDLLPVRGKSR